MNLYLLSSDSLFHSKPLQCDLFYSNPKIQSILALKGYITMKLFFDLLKFSC